MKGLRQCGAEVADFNLGARMDFFHSHRQYDQRLDSMIRPYTDHDAVQLAIDGLFSETFKGWPDLVLVVSGFFVPVLALPLLRTRGMKVAYLFTESPYQDDQQASCAGYADLAIVNDPINLDRYPSGSYYQPHCYDPDVHHPGTGPKTWDFSFVGTGFDSRVEFFESVDWTDLRVRFGGFWPSLDDDSALRAFVDDPHTCTDNPDTADVYRTSKVSANLYRREANSTELATGWAMGPREVELAACRTFFLRDSRPEGDELFPMLPTYGSADEFGDLVRWWASHDAERELAASQASSAIADRTFENAARRLLSLLDT